MKGLTIRKATVADADAIVRMRLLLQEHVENSNSMIWRLTERGKRLLKRDIRKDISSKRVRVLIAEEGSEIVGFVQGVVLRRSDYSPRTVGLISLLYVMKRHRRKGVGRALVREVCEFFGSNKAEHLTLGYVVGNIEAERFWKELGFASIISTSATSRSELTSRLKTS